MTNRLSPLLVLILSAAYSGGTFATVGSTLDDWFDDMNYVNVTNPGVYEGQTARYATLGGYSARAPIVRPFNFVNVQTPRFSAGCGGIDLYAGGFSAINADEFVDNLRAIGQNAQSLAFMLGIQIVSPQLSGIMEKINTYAQKFNSMSMDSCQAASAMVGGAYSMFETEKSECIAGRRESFGEDFVEASWACSTGGRKKETENATGAKLTDFTKGNIAWYAMMQNPLFSSDTAVAEAIMNLTGTFILRDAGPNDDAGKRIRFIPSAILEDGQLSERGKTIYISMLFGNSQVKGTMVPMRLYRCNPLSNDPESCDNPTNTLQSVNPNWEGLYAKVERLVASIITKIRDDNPLTPEEIGLISSSSIPLYRYLAASAAYFPRGSNLQALTGNYTQLIAEDILLRGLSNIVESFEASAGNLPNGISGSERVKNYLTQLQEVKGGLAKLREQNRFDIRDYFEMQKQIQQYEQVLMSRLGSGMVTSAMWGQ